ncbi:sugar phosphate permease [Motilibacter rhizosphaerae]|uniref:Sugar phosphate permease n=1 Tax=Motilibacter rhizosphaerae TaxID=598652 RepID=A0A4V2F3F3_9ACTN|nr:MFS transporter [Motilibacter rhizosphaerae]RZS82913.1 sugar phosphate permease [Motilibacter rhizosphaerae]
MSAPSTTTPRTTSAPSSARAYLVWGVAVVGYCAAVFHRSSLGVAGLLATDRLGISAGLLGVLSLVQLSVYAAMQIPVGALLDRLGPRRLLVTGALLMALGQELLAQAHGVPLAALARGVLGCGDALTFISVLRLVGAWFPARRNPLFVQLTGQIGALGAIVSSYPLTAALHGPGWSATFTAAAAVSLVLAVVLGLVVRDTPLPGGTPPAATTGELRQHVADAWREPGTRLGFWTHLSTQFSGNVFTLLWGFPFLVVAEGRSSGQAAALLTLLTLTGMAAGPVVGGLVGRYPFHRSWLVLTIVAISAAAWALVLLWPGHAPTPLLVGLVVVLGCNGVGSMIGFDYARTFNPARRAGSASGIVNVGGFAASLTTVLLVGLVVQELSPPGHYAAHALRWAMALQYPVWALGAWQVLRLRRTSRRELAERDPDAYAALRRGEVVLPS